MDFILSGKKKSKGFLARLSGASSAVRQKKHKYSLLRDQDDEKSLLHDTKGSLGEEIPMSRQKGYNDEEDILFDKMILSNSASAAKSHPTIKKYNNLI